MLTLQCLICQDKEDTEIYGNKRRTQIESTMQSEDENNDKPIENFDIASFTVYCV